MSTDLARAIADAKATEDLAALVAAVVRQLPAAAAPAPTPTGSGCGCQHHGPANPPAQSRRPSTLRPVAIGAAVICGACAFTALFLAVALTAVAVGVSAVVMLLVVRELRRGGTR
jgi:hypothetical protein